MGNPLFPKRGRAGFETPSSIALQVLLGRNPPHHDKMVPKMVSPQEIATVQREDPIWSKIICALESGNDSTSPKLPILSSEFQVEDDMIICRNKIYHQNIILESLFYVRETIAQGEKQ